ncbi:hypothetical protein ACGFW5_34580 [Streptomyces sp. NPDC048416]|uniref:hypothetical protein n=1 Tax=Streptomyces sp. NPDC048416 TaxID=3365546 RepID=UPI00371C350F
MSAAGIALMLGGAGIVLAAGPAQAAEVSYSTECIPPSISGLPPVEGTTKVQITAPATAKVGDEVDVVWKFTQAASNNPNVLDLNKDVVQPTGTLKAAGAQSADIAMKGPRTNPPIPKNSPMVLSDMTAKLKLTKAGDVTLTPDAYNINVNQIMSTDTKCTPKVAVGVGATIKVTDAGGTSGGTTSGGTTGSTTSGGTTGSTTSGGTSGSTTSGGTTGSTTGGTTSGGTTGSTTSGGTTGGSTSGSASGGTGGGSTSGATTGGSGGQSDFPGKEVAVTFACTAPGPASIQSKVTINAKKSGGSYALTVKTAKGVMNSPADLPAGALKPSMQVVVAGADKGTVSVTGPASPDPIKSGAPVDLTDMTGTYTPGASGKSTLAPGDLSIDVTLGGSPIHIPCKVSGTAPVSLELDTAAQPGGAAGGSGTSGAATTAGTSGSAGASSSSGGLAQTGASDTGALRALGLVAGTVLLLGGAIFTFTPWRRLRGTR